MTFEVVDGHVFQGEEGRDPDLVPCPLFSELFSCSARRVQIKPVHGRYGYIKSTSRYNDPKGAFLKFGGAYPEV